MAFPGSYDFPKQVKGDTFRRQSFTFNFSLEGFKADLWISDGFSCEPIYKLSSYGPEGGLTIEGDIIWVEPFEISMLPGQHKYDLQLISPEGEKTTFIEGLFPIKDDVTKV